jgi:hypothetical protein
LYWDVQIEIEKEEDAFRIGKSDWGQPSFLTGCPKSRQSGALASSRLGVFERAKPPGSRRPAQAVVRNAG